MMSFRVGHYRIHLDALLARLLFVWRLYVLGIILIGVAILTLPSLVAQVMIALTPTAPIVVDAPDATAIRIDGQRFTGTAPLGNRHIEATWGDAIAWRDIVVESSDITMTVSLTPFWHQVQTSDIPFPANWSPSFVLIEPDRAATVIVSPTPSAPPRDRGQHQTYRIGRGDVRRQVSSEAYDGLYAADDHGRIIARVSGSGTEQQTLRMTVATSDTSQEISVPLDPVLGLVVDIQRNGVIVFTQNRDDRTAMRTQVHFVSAEGRRLPIGALAGRPTFVLWDSSNAAAAIVTQTETRLSLAVLHGRETMVLDLVDELPNTGAFPFAPPMYFADGTLFWATPTEDGAVLRSFSLERRLSRRSTSRQVLPAFLSVDVSHGTIEGYAQNNRYRFYLLDTPDAPPLGIADIAQRSTSVGWDLHDGVILFASPSHVWVMEYRPTGEPDS